MSPPKNGRNKADLRRSELLVEVSEVTAAQLVKVLGLPLEKAAEVGNSIADFLMDHWRGQTIYITRDWKFSCQERDWSIYRKMERGNANELAAEHDLSAVRIYQIYKRCHAELLLQRAQEKTNPPLKGK